MRIAKSKNNGLDTFGGMCLPVQSRPYSMSLVEQSTPLLFSLYDYSDESDKNGFRSEHVAGTLQIRATYGYHLASRGQIGNRIRLTVHVDKHSRTPHDKSFMICLTYTKCGKQPGSLCMNVAIPIQPEFYVHKMGGIGTIMPYGVVEFDYRQMFEVISGQSAEMSESSSLNLVDPATTTNVGHTKDQDALPSAATIATDANLESELTRSVGPPAPTVRKVVASWVCKQTFKMVISAIEDIARAKSHGLDMEADGTPTAIAKATLLLFDAGVSAAQFSDASVVWKKSRGVTDGLYKFLEYADKTDKQILEKVSITITPSDESVPPIIAIDNTHSPLLDDPLRQVALLYWQLTCSQ